MDGYFNLTEWCNDNSIRLDRIIENKIINKDNLITKRGRGGGSLYPISEISKLDNYLLTKKSSPKYHRLYAVCDGRYIKIGFASNTLKRLEMLQVGNVNKLTIMAESSLIENAHKLEKKLHNKYKSFHVRGEWFLLDPSEHFILQEFILNI